MPTVSNRVTLLTPYCPQGFQLSVVGFKQCLEGCWDHSRLLEQSCLTLHQLELSQSWDKRDPSQASLSPASSQHQAELKLKPIYQVSKFKHSSCSFSNYVGYLFTFSVILGQSFVEHKLIQLYANHQAHPSWSSRKFKFAYHKNDRMGWKMGFSSEELQLFVFAATGWNTRWKQPICCWDYSNDCRPVPRTWPLLSAGWLSKKQGEVAVGPQLPAACKNHALLALSKLGSDHLHLSRGILGQRSSWGESVSLVPSWSQHSPRKHVLLTTLNKEWAMHLSGWFKSWEIWSCPKCHEGVWIQCHSQKNGYFRPDLAHIILRRETRLLLCVQRWQPFALVILTITFWSDATDEWLI